jgi:DNA polymerase III subunit epsilon
MLKSLFNQFDSIVFLDLETSGLNAREDEIIELGALRVRQGEGKRLIEEPFSCLVRLSEGRRLNERITAITGITQELLTREGLEKDALRDILTELFGTGQPLVVAYNAQFDLCFLYYFLYSFGKEKIMQNVKMLDALTVYKDRRDYPHKLENAVAAYALEAKNTHRAVDDAIATYALLCAMEEEQGDIDLYVNLFGYNPKFGISGPKISSVKYVPQPYTRTKKAYEL